MPQQNIEPDLISLEEFRRGFLPDLDTTVVPVDGFSDVLNLLPHLDTGILETRPGFKRFGTFQEDDYEARTLNAFNVIYGALHTGRTFLMVVEGNDVADFVDNVKVRRIDLADGTHTRVDDVGRAWNSGTATHFGVVIDNVYYGGGDSDPIYGYRPFYVNGVESSAAIAWDPDATMPQRAPTNWTATTAYVVHDRVEDGGFVWVCIADNTAHANNRPKNGWNSGDFWQRLAPRFDDWVDGATYAVGDQVMRNVTGNANFPRGLAGRTVNTYSAFVATRDHTADVNNRPPSYAWEPFRGPQTRVGKYRGTRLFVRDGDVGTSRIRYSGAVTASGTFDITDWESDDALGPGFIDIRTGDGDDVRAFAELGDTLLIFKRRSTHALAGISPVNWKLRQIDADVGCIDPRAVVEHQGLVYFLSDRGFYLTDGVVVKEAPGSSGIRNWLMDRLQWVQEANLLTPKARMSSYKDRIFLTTPSSEGDKTLIYDPEAGAFWPQSFATYQFAVNAVDRTDQLFFTSSTEPAMVLQWDHPDANNQDDTRATVAAMQDIPWHARFGWLSFSTAREQRMLRRSWVKVRATAKTITFAALRNYIDTNVWSVNRVVAGPVGAIEGQVIRTLDALSFRLSGTSAPVSILGIALHTIFRRKRYGRA